MLADTKKKVLTFHHSSTPVNVATPSCQLLSLVEIHVAIHIHPHKQFECIYKTRQIPHFQQTSLKQLKSIHQDKIQENYSFVAIKQVYSIDTFHLKLFVFFSTRATSANKLSAVLVLNGFACVVYCTVFHISNNFFFLSRFLKIYLKTEKSNHRTQ